MKIVLVRHGEPRYDEVKERGYPFQGHDLGKLTEDGVKQAHQVSSDERLKGATLIVASPYTRALQTGAIISKNLNIDLTVENDVHEWMPNMDFTNDSIDNAYNEYIAARGEDVNTKSVNWEPVEHLRKRVLAAITPYKKDHDKIIVACHGLVITALTDFDDLIEYCGIREIEI